MRFAKVSKKNSYSKFITNIRSNTVAINVFDPEKIADLNLVNKEKSNYKFKITKIACAAIIFFAIPLTAFASEISSKNIIDLTNKERANNNIQIVVSNKELALAANNKANDMLSKGYFEHYSPYGKTPWEFIKEANYDYLYAGENLAIDFKTSEGIHDAWMKSGSHRKNILNAKYDEIGIGLAKGSFQGHETTIVVQMFGARESFLSNSFINRVTNLLGVRYGT